MLASINWMQAVVFFVLGALLGQRFAHMHPVPSVKAANGGM